MPKYNYLSRISRVFVDAVVKSPTGRLSFPHLVEPVGGEIDGRVIEPKYQGQLLVDKNHPEVAWFEKQMGEHKKQMLAEYNKYSKTKISDCELWRDGDRTDLEKYPNNKNCWIIIARHKDPVKCFDAKRERVDPKDLIGGMLVRFALRPHLGPTGLSYYLEGVQLIKDDGLRFGGANRDYTDVLEAIEDNGSEVFAGSNGHAEGAAGAGAAEADATTSEESFDAAAATANTAPVENTTAVPPTGAVTGVDIKAQIAAKVAAARGKTAAKNLLGSK